MKDLGQGEIQALYSLQVYNHYPLSSDPRLIVNSLLLDDFWREPHAI